MARKKKQADVGVNMTPMIDIVFQLILFFVLASSFASAEIDKKVKVPVFDDKESTARDEPQVANRVIINMATKEEDGKELDYIKIGSQPIGTDMDKLREALAGLDRKAKEKDPEAKMIVILRAHRTLETKYPARVMMIAGALGITDVQFATPIGQIGARMRGQNGGN